MKKIFNCRRSSLGLIAMIALSLLGIIKGQDVSMAISAVVASIAASNAYQGKKNELEG